jgi:hypothetical protein
MFTLDARCSTAFVMRTQQNAEGMERERMAAFRTFLICMLVSLVSYTVVVGTNHGWNLLPIFFGDIIELNWSGQFNLDFMTFLAVSALWVAWRHHFSIGGIALATVAFFGGMLFLAPYLLWASFRARGDASILLLGAKRAGL